MLIRLFLTLLDKAKQKIERNYSRKTNLNRRYRLIFTTTLVICLGAAAIFSVYSIVAAPNPPTAFWKFDEGIDNSCSGGTNDACDATSNANDLANTNGVWKEEGLCISGKCLYFDGNGDYLSKADDADFDFAAADSFSISGWFRHDTISAIDYIVGKHGVTGTDGGYKVYMDADGDIVCGIDDDDTFDPDASATSTSANYDDNRWHHFECVKDGTSSLTLYIDGNVINTNSSISGVGTLVNSDTLYVGNDSTSSSGWAGFLDEIRFYTYARSAPQVKTDVAKDAGARGASAILGSQDNAFLTSGLVGYWKLDETSSTAADSSGVGTTLTNNNTVTYSAAKFGNGAEFNGTTQYFEAADSATLSVTGSLTLSAWINPDDTTGSQNILGKWDGTNNSYLLVLESDELRMYIDSSSNYQTTSSSNISANTFTHVAGVYDATSATVRLFVNGIEQTSTTTGTIPSSIGDDAGEIVVGADDSATNYYDGHIDEARIYNRALSASEINSLYNWAPGPIAHYTLDQSASSTETTAPGGGMVVYANSTTTDAMQYRIMDSTGTWVAAAASTGDVDAGEDQITQLIKLYSHPYKNEKVLVSSHDDGTSTFLYAQVYNGDTGTWSTPEAMGTGTSDTVDPSTPYFDGGYLANGTFMLVYSDQTATPKFRTWQGTGTFSSAISTQSVVSIPYQVVMKVRPGTNEVMVVTYDIASDTNSLYYDGSGFAAGDWAALAEHATTGETASQMHIDFTWSQNDPTRGLLVFTNSTSDTTPNINVFTADGNGSGSWGTANEATSSGDEPAANMVIDRPNANEFLFCVKDSTLTSPDINCFEDDDNDTTPVVNTTTLNGGVGELTTGTDAMDAGEVGTGTPQRPFALGYEQSSGATTIAVYSDTTAIAKLRKYDPETGTNGTWDTAETSLTTTTEAIENVAIIPAPDSDDMAVLIRDTAQDVSLAFWDGTNNVIYSSGDRTQTQLSATSGSVDESMTADFAWDLYPQTITTLDSSTYGHTGTFGSTMTNEDWVSGKYGQAVDFDGTNDYVDIYSSSLNTYFNGNSGTISVWLKVPTSAWSDSTQRKAVEIGVDANNKLLIGKSSSSNTVDLQHIGGGTTDSTTISTSTTDWFHVAISWSSSLVTFYYNGQVVATDTSPGTYAGSLASTLAHLSVSATNPWLGQIDDVRIYNYPRTGTQVIEDMNGGHPLGGSPVSSKEVHWNFDEGQGTTANNTGSATLNATTGTLTSFGASSTSTSGWTPSGKLNKGIVFDGSDDKVLVATASDDAVDFIVNEPFTVSAWVYPTTMSGTNEYDAIITKYDATSSLRSYRLALFNDDADSTGNFYAELYDESADQTITASSATDGIAVNTWYHVVMIYNGGAAGAAGDLKLFVDGIQVAQNSANTSFLGPEALGVDFSVGDYDATDVVAANTAFTGRIDEVKVYTAALSSEEVLIDKNNASVISVVPAQASVNEESTVTGGLGTAPVLIWNLDENTGTSARDTSGNENTGTLTNTPLWSSGKLGSGVIFAGSNQHITRADDADLDFAASTSFTIESWFKHNTATATETIASKIEATGTDGGYKLKMESDGDITCETDDDDADTTIDDTATTTAATYDDDNWHHVACVYDVSNTDLYIYIDGILAATDSTTTTNSLANDDAFFYGIEAATGSEDWIGSLDNLVIYNYARSQAQIAYDYNRGKPISWWKMDECTGTSLFDSGIKGTTLTLTIGASGSNDATGTCSSGDTTESWHNGTIGKRHYSLHLDGTDDSAAAASVTWSNTLSFTVWANHDAMANQDDIIEKYDGSTNGPQFLNSHVVGLCGRIFQGVSNSIGRCATIASLARTTGVWYHYAMTYDGGTTNSAVKIFMNGQQVDNSNLSSGTFTGFTDAAGTLTVGGVNFDGRIDDLRVYNYPLSETQIQQIMNDGSVNFQPESGAP